MAGVKTLFTITDEGKKRIVIWDENGICIWIGEADSFQKLIGPMLKVIDIELIV